ncbi:MAG: hypothetical protein KU29_14200 [Sulfurovum sp. FS06-10]|jgi:outer membrane protein OmpA-like peptidoglycan-associated protein|nr:MAG: hypothetical protein KU29_14200 [Sulfurovum sp. FS06-10]
MKSNSEWMSISDMMSGLMLIFMFIAISFMIQIQTDKDKMKEIAITYNKDKKELNKDLNLEFSKDLTKWEAQISQDNIITFNSPDVLFEGGESQIKEEFKNILNDFFPRYIKVLSSKKYIHEIDEIRIEGHTSDNWNGTTNAKDIYLNNMKLSQERANNVLSYCYTIDAPFIQNNRVWLEQHFRANGMAFSKLKYMDKNQTIPDILKSRRVEFKVQMKTEEKIYKILKASE